jgi:hypothetical protein
MLLKGIDIYVYKLDDDGTFDALGEINKYTSLMWPDKYNGFTTFELNVPVTHENRNLIKQGNIIWCGGDNACIIEIINSDKDENGQKTYKVKGRTLEMLLTTRIIWGTYSCVNKYSSTAMYEIVDKQCVNPSDSYRKIPFLECAEDKQFGKIISFQKTGGEVYDSIESIATDAELGFDILFRPREKKLIFKVIEGVDRTVTSMSGDVSNLVIFSTDLEDILSSSYYTNDQDVKTLAYVAGEGEGAERKYIISGNAASKGLLRREMYIDARDLQSEVSNEDGTIIKINEDDYRDMLNDRGTEKLAEQIKSESFEAKMRVIGNTQYKYGIDYDKGDKVIVQDEDLGVQVIGKITEVSENYDDEYELIITFGYSYPTLIQKVKRQISR